MTRILLSALITAVTFLAADMVMIGLVLRPLFQDTLGDLLATPMRGGPAVLFYLLYIAATAILVLVPALKDGSAVSALLKGAVLGAAAYGTYELTNLATLAAWTPVLAAVDTLWGTVLTGGSAYAGVRIALLARR